MPSQYCLPYWSLRLWSLSPTQLSLDTPEGGRERASSYPAATFPFVRRLPGRDTRGKRHARNIALTAPLQLGEHLLQHFYRLGADLLGEVD